MSGTHCPAAPAGPVGPVGPAGPVGPVGPVLPFSFSFSFSLHSPPWSSGRIRSFLPSLQSSSPPTARTPAGPLAV
ncbi:hypothetical protein C3488_16080 [Streptomyces sp. Ru72]|nr:hypothetical protein C3488_16080 [Streptomyces sp. Ru72]